MNLGFEPDPILIVDVNAKRSSGAPETRLQLFERARQAALGVPGVRSAGSSGIPPIDGSSWDTLIENPEGLSLPESERAVWANAGPPGWFATYGIQPLAGRRFHAHHAADRRRWVICNRSR